MLLLFLACPGVWAEPRHIHLSWESDPSRSVTVTWRTESVEPSVVEYGPDESYGLSASGIPGELHHVELSGLSPSTLYHYRCGHTGSWSHDLNFTTGPSDPSEGFVFAVVGDDRSGYDVRRSISLAILDAGASFVLHTGDLVSTGGELSQWERWFESHRELLSHTVMMPAIGNHEENAPEYFEQFALPGNEQWYSFDYGNVHFVALTTEYQLTGSQLDWLEDDLASTNATWKFVYFHRPMYSSGSAHGSDLGVRRAWESVLNRYHVDLAFCGHNHIYERTLPVRGGQVVDADGGIIHITAAGGGAGLHSVASPRDSWSAVALSEHHYLLFAVKGGMLDFQARLPGGMVFDDFELRKEPLPDLRPLSISTGSPYPGPGERCTISMSVRNDGQLRAENSTMIFLVDGGVRAEVPLGALDPGQETTVESAWVPVEEGAASIEVIVDGSDEVDEGLREDNNRISMQAIVSRPKPDLVVSGLACEGVPAEPGERTKLLGTVTNAGNDASGAFAVNLVLEGADLEHVAQVEGLEPGESAEVEVSWTAQAGDWRLSMAADSSNDVDEIREGNNWGEYLVRCREWAKLGPAYIPRGLSEPGPTVVYYNSSEGDIGVESEECFVIWGINGWERPPEELSGPGTLKLSRFSVERMDRVNQDLWVAALPRAPEIGWVDLRFSDHALFPGRLDENEGSGWQIPGRPWAVERLDELLLAIGDAEAVGIDVSPFTDIARSAEQCLLDGDYVGLDVMIGNATLQVRKLESTVLLERATQQYQEALREGLDVDRAGIYLEAGASQLEKGQYAECKRLSEQVLKMVDDARAAIGEVPLALAALILPILIYRLRR